MNTEKFGVVALNLEECINVNGGAKNHDSGAGFFGVMIGAVVGVIVAIIIMNNNDDR